MIKSCPGPQTGGLAREFPTRHRPGLPLFAQNLGWFESSVLRGRIADQFFGKAAAIAFRRQGRRRPCFPAPGRHPDISLTCPCQNRKMGAQGAFMPLCGPVWMPSPDVSEVTGAKPAPPEAGRADDRPGPAMRDLVRGGAFTGKFSGISAGSGRFLPGGFARRPVSRQIPPGKQADAGTSWFIDSTPAGRHLAMSMNATSGSA